MALFFSFPIREISDLKTATCEDHHFQGIASSISSSVCIMLPAAVTRYVIQTMDWIAGRVLSRHQQPDRQRTGRRGEEEAYFYLRKLGYVMVGRNFRSPRCHGEIDLIGWDQDVLCFVEVKTRTTHEVKPAEAAVDRYKRREIAEVAREYLRRMPPECQWRFDIVSVYYDGRNPSPQFEVFQNASLAA